MKPAELARISGIGEPKLSRWLNDVQSYISDDDLEKLATALTPEDSERAELLVARLKDHLKGPGAEYVQIRVGDRVLRDTGTPYRLQLAPKLDRAFEILREHVSKDQDLRSIILSLANLFETGEATPELRDKPPTKTPGIKYKPRPQ